jgi:hypothetical protein
VAREKPDASPWLQQRRPWAEQPVTGGNGGGYGPDSGNIPLKKFPVTAELVTAVSGVLDDAIVAEPHIEPGAAAKTIDPSKSDSEVLAKKF